MEYILKPYNIDDLGTMPSAMNSAVAAIAHEINLNFETKSIRRNLTDSFQRVFESRNWKMDTNLHFEPARKRTLHYYKDRILVQVSWRHYNFIGTELLKFQVEFQKKRIDAGVFICITENLSKRFKELYKASRKKNTFEGSITMEKVIQYLQNVSQVITVPLAIMGLTYS